MPPSHRPAQVRHHRFIHYTPLEMVLGVQGHSKQATCLMPLPQQAIPLNPRHRSSNCLLPPHARTCHIAGKPAESQLPAHPTGGRHAARGCTVCTPVFKEMTPLQAAATLDFWLLSWVFSTSVGSGLALLNNLGQVVRALGGEASECVMLVSLFSVANAGGRLAMGWLPEHALQVSGWRWWRAVLRLLVGAAILAVCVRCWSLCLC
jgi:hypothetical protein